MIELNGSLSRRAVLRGMFGTGVLAATSSLVGDEARYGLPFADQVGEIQRTEYHYDPNAPRTAPSVEQVAVPENPRLASGLGKHSVAYAVVHAGYLYEQAPEMAAEYGRLWDDRDYEYAGVWDFMDVLRGKYGDYKTHCQNISKLYSSLGTSDVPVLAFVGERDASNDTLPSAELRPPKNAFQIVTPDGFGEIAEQVTYESTDASGRSAFVQAKQQPNLIFDALRAAGVKEIRMAGEYSFSPWAPSSLACLGGIAKIVKEKGFSIRGIKGAVFPAEPALMPDRKIEKEIYFDLYQPLGGITVEQVLAEG